MTDLEKHNRMANAIRFLAADAVEAAKSGHPGLPMGAADIATVLFTQVMHYDPTHPDWPDRDRFVLSAGHGSMLLYAVHYLLGSEDFTLEQLKNFRQIGALTAGHPEYGHCAGIETTTGPLGQGLANAVGMAMAERHMRETFGAELSDHYTYARRRRLCLMEGISQEAISLMAQPPDRHLGRQQHFHRRQGLDHRQHRTAPRRFQASGWATIAIDDHDPETIASALQCRARERPPDADRGQDHHQLPARPTRAAPKKVRRLAGSLPPARRSAGRRPSTFQRHSRRLADRRLTASSQTRRIGKSAWRKPTPKSAASSSGACAATCLGFADAMSALKKRSRDRTLSD
ncbi:MAG: hypothetical protein HPM95_09560 [Alphaproteobacteria bacterium]|nr:hypothetical protein [Alphaproteobacteria bacterium]